MKNCVDWKSKIKRTGASCYLTGRKPVGFAKDELGTANLVLGLIASLSERQSELGDKHIYRGVLSFEGKSYRAIAEIALRELHENEWLDYEQLQERLEQIDEAVKTAG